MAKNSNFCSGCGNGIKKGQLFCSNCGKKLKSIDENETNILEESNRDEKKIEVVENNKNSQKIKVGDIIRYVIGGFLCLIEMPSLFQSNTFLNSLLWILFAISLFPFPYRKILFGKVKSVKVFKAIQIIIPVAIYIVMVILTNIGVIGEDIYGGSSESQNTTENSVQKIVRIVNHNLSTPNQEIEKYELNSETGKYDFKIKSTDNSYTPYTCAEDSQTLAKKLAGSSGIESIKIQCLNNGKTVYYVKIGNIETLTSENINDNIKYFDENNNEVNTNIDTLKSNVINDYKKSCNTYNYKDVLRAPEEYQGKNAYWFGEIIQVVSKSKNYSVFRIDVSCEKYKYIDGYTCSDTVYVTYYGSDSFIENDMVKMWGEMNGTETYTTILGASVTIPKFTAKYMELQ